MRNAEIMIPSRYPLNWFDFCVRWRFVAGPILALIQTIMTYVEFYSNNRVNNGAVILITVFELTMLLCLLALSIFTVIEARRFTKVGFILMYIYLISIVAWNYYCSIYSETAYGLLLISAVSLLLESIYFYKRKSLFVHKKGEKVCYYHSAGLFSEFKEDEYDQDKELNWNEWLKEKGLYPEELNTPESALEEPMVLGTILENQEQTLEDDVENLVIIAPTEEKEETKIEQKYSVLFCKNCGKKLEEDEIFCSHCGTEIKK